MEKLLVVDDSDDVREQFLRGFGSEYTLLLADDSQAALTLFLKQRPEVVVLDLDLPPRAAVAWEGFRCLEELLAGNQSTKVIVMTGNGDKVTALRAVQSGAYDFLQKPIEFGELKTIVKRAFHLHALEEENRRLRMALEKKGGVLSGIIGQCPAMLEAFSTMRKVAPSDVAVLIEGESGTGKEQVAQAIHAMSRRRERDFVPVNCGMLPESLLESELFGNEKRAFAGSARVQEKAELTLAGTLFLDEIDGLSAPLQVKLLRYLQDRTGRLASGKEDVSVGARIIAATNRNIGEDIKTGRFREDLYYRIAVVAIHLPPLRERKEDIALLGTLFLRRFGEDFKKRVKGFSAASLELMESYAWPGNVRELEHRIQRAVILSEATLIEPHDLGFLPKPALPGTPVPERKCRTLKEARDQVEREMIIQAMGRHGGNIAHASEELGISRPTFYDILKKHGLSHVIHQRAA